MTTDALDKRIGSCSQMNAMATADIPIGRFSETARRLQAILHVIDVLTEKNDVTDMDRIALDVLLSTGRDYVNALVLQIEQLSGVPTSSEAPPDS
jgi:hypothetical protein